MRVTIADCGQVLRRLTLGLLCLSFGSGAQASEKRYGPGVSDTEIRIGNTMPYSGPLSAYGLIGRTEAAYFKKVNDEGGVNGRTIKFISYDDAFSPPKTVEQTRKLIDSDEVLLIFGATGTAANSAIMPYMNRLKIPQLFVASGASKFSNPKAFPWTMGWIPSYQIEATIYAKHILSRNADAKIAIIYQRDDFGRDYLDGLKRGLGEKASQLVAEAGYDITSPTITSEIVSLKSSGADTLIVAALSKFSSQTLRTLGDIGWQPQVYLSNTSIAIDTVLRPAGLDNAKGAISAAYRKDPEDPAWANDAGMIEFKAFMDKYYPEGPKNDQTAFGYLQAIAMVQVLKQCGDDLTRESVMRTASSLHDLELPLLIPGIKLNTSPTDYSPIKQYKLMRFDGDRWQTFGEVRSE
ncbi:ABC transporter substrate-binding protein [Bradyrhizobium sp. 195]|nr:ABC transporter substrate-binding protein [Bradyrhizobium sp. 195]